MTIYQLVETNFPPPRETVSKALTVPGKVASGYQFVGEKIIETDEDLSPYVQNGTLKVLTASQAAAQGGIDESFMPEADEVPDFLQGIEVGIIDIDRYDRRRAIAEAQEDDAIKAQTTNDDLGLTKTRPGGDVYTALFSKPMPHNSFGEVTVSDMNTLLTAINLGTTAGYDAVPLDSGAVRKLEDPQGKDDFSLSGADAFNVDMRAPAGMQTAETAGEMVEVYGMALLRDESFADIAAGTTGAEATVTDLLADLNAVGGDFRGPKDNGAVTRGTLFRGIGPGETVGPYVSQFLQHDFTYGALTVVQEVNREDDSTVSTSEAGFLDIQNGVTPGGANKSGDMERMWSVRTLGTYVHNDPVFQAGWHAALILLGNGAPLDPGIPTFTNRTNFQSLGGAEMLPRIGHVATLALRAAWRQKWVHMRLRPEVMAARVHHQINGEAYGLSSLVTGAATTGRVLTANTADGNATYLLKMQYPEGSPTHPAYPAGHAVLAGAVCTLLKAWFDGTTLMKNLSGGTFKIIEATANTDTYAGLLAAPITDPAVVDTLTVNHELNKLASNIATARNMAGVHYRSDGDEGVLLGEKVAIQYLKDVGSLVKSKTFAGFTLEKFDGTTVTIAPNA